MNVKKSAPEFEDKAELLFNPDSSKKTVYVKCGERVYQEWNDSVEWVWTNGMKYGCFGILILSKKGCYLRHENKFSDDSKSTSKNEEEAYSKALYQEIIADFRQHERLLETGRLYFIAPTEKVQPGYAGDKVTRRFIEPLAEQLAEELDMVGEVLRYDSGYQDRSIKDYPEYGAFEVYFDRAKYNQPLVYFGGAAWDSAADPNVLTEDAESSKNK